MTEHSEAAQSDKKPIGRGVSIRIIGAVSIVIAILLAFFAFTQAGYIADVKDATEESEQRYVECNSAITDLQEASDYLTSQARMFVVTGRSECLDAYLNELYVANRRGRAVDTLKTSFTDDLQAATELQVALDASDELAQIEFSAMRLAADYYGISDVPAAIAGSRQVEGEQAMTRDEKIALAREMLLNEGYEQTKETIRLQVEASSQALLDALNQEINDSDVLMQNLLFQMRIAVALLLCVVMVLVLVLLMYVLKPLNHYIRRIQKNEPLEADGSYELRYLANAYNAMYEDNSKRIKQLREFAERDPLTGISNRHGYDSFLATHTRNIALLLIDIDDFKEFNKVYGRDTGNATLVKLAEALSTAFRSTDFPCRLESDKFAVVMTDMNTDLRDAVSSKIAIVNAILADDSDDLPLITVSVGVAFSTEGMSDRDIYEAADIALDRAQSTGRNCIAFYGESKAAQAMSEMPAPIERDLGLQE